MQDYATISANRQGDGHAQPNVISTSRRLLTVRIYRPNDVTNLRGKALLLFVGMLRALFIVAYLLPSIVCVEVIQSKRTRITRETRGQVEALLAGAVTKYLQHPDFYRSCTFTRLIKDQLPANLLALLALLPQTDIFLQDEM